MIKVCRYKKCGKKAVIFEEDNEEALYYELPAGKLLVLLFQDISGRLFTTIRRWTQAKEEYYRGLRGREFEVVITEV